MMLVSAAMADEASAAVAPTTPAAGGETTVADTSHNAFGRVLANLDAAEWPRMLLGKRIFVRDWQPPGSEAAHRAGLGPLFNAASCADCHFKDGRGGRDTGQAPPLIFRLDARESPASDRPDWGGQLQDRAVGMAPEGRVEMSVRDLAGRYGDGEPFVLRLPDYRVVGARHQPRLSPRVPPLLVGVGLLEAIDPEAILAWADPDDVDGDGISGRARWLAGDSGPLLGRFGWTAAQASLPDQLASALAEDMGLSSERRPIAGLPAGMQAVAPISPEVSRRDFDLLVDYLRRLAPPAQRRDHPSFVRGRALFDAIGCADCHRPSIRTGRAADIAGPRALAEQTIAPFSDFLLHDLGAALADDGIGEAGVAPGEWRTAPLWGLGLMETVNGGLYLLHDGRARSFEEAILWHGGEALAARKGFMHLDQAERRDLVAFLESL